ncbi:hypothetical protein [Sutterella wadsworthensis]|uniref:hypothetical protein n=1 Tax=Sutterella wadsworthensis TaxID=40545 RepID=UPI0013F6193C|nr:hypothetical protein [Sutterella wadsworthensis]
MNVGLPFDIPYQLTEGDVMTKEIKLGQWVEYLNRVTGGFRCSVCGHQRWETQTNGDVVDDIILTTITDYGSIDDPPEPPKITDGVIAMRCAVCGHALFFDRLFVEEKINGNE